MQIGKYLYVDIKIKDAKDSDFLSYADLMDMRLIETAGASLPVFYMAFTVDSMDIANKIFPKNMIEVTFGESLENSSTFEVHLYKIKPPSADPSGTRWVVEASGFIANKSFMVEQASKAYKGNSLSVARDVIRDYFAKPLQFNQIMSADLLGTGISRASVNERNTTWMRHNQTACTFLAETILHMNIAPSFPLFTFDKFGFFHIDDFDTLVRRSPSRVFVSRPIQGANEIQYVNSFSVDNYQDVYNLYSGYNKVTEIYGATTGLASYDITMNEPILAATKEVETDKAGNRVVMNDIQSDNVHDTYVESFLYNTDKLLSLSSVQGALRLTGPYNKTIRPLELVKVEVGHNDDRSLEGLYIIDTVLTHADFSTGSIATWVYVTRDNKNRVEDYIAKPEIGMKIRKRYMQKILNTVARIRRAYASAMYVMDGRFLSRMLSFALATKNNILRSFSVSGVLLDLTSSVNTLKSLICIGNSLMNALLSMVLPEELSYTFRDYVIRRPSAHALVSNYIARYVPSELLDIVSSVSDSIFEGTSALNSIAKDNGVKSDTLIAVSTAGAISSQVIGEGGKASDTTILAGETVMADTSEIDYIAENQDKVQGIIDEFDENTNGLDIPFPIISITESEAVLPEDKLKDFVATETINNLANLGYLNNIDVEEFKNVLTGKEPLTFDLINRFNENAGSVFYYRYWGTFTDLTNLTSFAIKKSFKDKYRLIPCTKLVNATKNSKIFFACPETERDLRFYINSKRVELPSFPVKLNVLNEYGKNIPYTVYYTETGYNSNSVLFEVKQGGLV